MKKLFSLLLVVAMLASLSLVAFAADTNVMSVEAVETDAGITVTYYITNPANVSSFTASIAVPTTLTTDKAYTLGEDFAGTTVTPATKTASGKYQVRFQQTFGTATDRYVTKTGKVEALSFVLTRVAGDETVYTAADFAYAPSLYASNIGYDGTQAYKSSTASHAAQFVAPTYTDARTPIVENPFSATASGTTITCIGKVDASATNYGVVFTAASTLDGARAQKFYGAMDGDTVSDGAEGTRTFTFGDWDGSFQIILEGVHAGEKELDFFVNDTVIEDTNFTLTVE